MPDTPNLNLPYPGLADSPDVPRDIQALAFAIDTLNVGHMVGDFKYSFQAADHRDWILCDGVARNRAGLHASYLALIDATMGIHPDPLKVYTPNGRRRFLAGADPGGANFHGVPPNLAAIAGEETHHLLITEMPAHNHGGVTGNRNNFIAVWDEDTNPDDSNHIFNHLKQFWGGDAWAGNFDNGSNHNHSISSQGADTPHNNLPPFLLANLFIATTTVGGGGGVGGADPISQVELDNEIAARELGDSTIPFTTRAASYQPVMNDAGSIIRIGAAGALDFTLPNDATTNYPLGAIIGVRRIGAGAVNLKKMGGVTIPNKIQPSGAADRTIADQFGEVSFHKVAANVFEAVGDLA